MTNAFVNGIVPFRMPSEAEVAEVLSILELSAEDLRCAFCGNQSTEWDHFRPLISGKRPTGYITEIANLVPACGKCNQSKSGAPWRAWMTGRAPQSPASRGIADLDARVQRLERFESWREPTRFDFVAAVGAELWDRHWSNWEKLTALMHECEVTAKELRALIQSRA
jgi:hypothetical protein